MTRSEKKEILLKVASKMFAEKGFKNTSIAKIAKAAGVRETIIYELFAGKEDLLLNIPIEKTAVLIQSLGEHLEGIVGAKNKLRKMIWHYLSFQEKNIEYITIVLFELRSNRKFYHSKAYNSFKEYNNIVMGILKQGQEEGVFHEKLCLPVFRNLIFGALDHVLYSYILFGKGRGLIEQADNLCEILLSVAEADQAGGAADNGPEGGHEWLFDKKKTIMQVALSLLAERGFDKTRISDIATTLNIGEASIYEYFKNKEDILFSIPVEKTKELLGLVTGNLEKNRKGEMELRAFVETYLGFLQAHKDYVAILLFELRFNRKFYRSDAYHGFKVFNDVLIDILKRGQADQSFRRDVNIYLVRHMIFGSIDHMALTWLLFGKPANLLVQSEHLTWLFLKALRN